MVHLWFTSVKFRWEQTLALSLSHREQNEGACSQVWTIMCKHKLSRTCASPSSWDFHTIDAWKISTNTFCSHSPALVWFHGSIVEAALSLSDESRDRKWPCLTLTGWKNDQQFSFWRSWFFRDNHLREWFSCKSWLWGEKAHTVFHQKDGEVANEEHKEFGAMEEDTMQSNQVMGKKKNTYFVTNIPVWVHLLNFYLCLRYTSNSCVQLRYVERSFPHNRLGCGIFLSNTDGWIISVFPPWSNMIKVFWPETKYIFEHQVTNLFPIISHLFYFSDYCPWFS